MSIRPIRRITSAEVTRECRACLRPLRQPPLDLAVITNLTALSFSINRLIRPVTVFFRRRLLQLRPPQPQPLTAPSNQSRGLRCHIIVTAIIRIIRTLIIQVIRWL